MGLDQRLKIVHEDQEVWAKDFRKVNFLHRWIEQHCNEGRETNCDDIELNLEQVAGLSLTCSKVLEASVLIDGVVGDGRSFDPPTGEWTQHTRPGKVIADPTVAHELLPTQSGFFFGDTEYDEYYLGDVRDVREACLAILEAGEQHHSHGGTPFRIVYWSWW
jgi:hypothetical protein